MSLKTRQLLLLVGLLAAFIASKVAGYPGKGPYGLDASYYYQIARHVAEGDGLKTSVSLYHEGISPLPAPSHIYPLWPLVLGLAGRAAGMSAAVAVLPPLLYVVDLLLLYALANRIVRRIAPGSDAGSVERDPVVTPGHVMVALFATNPIFWSATSHPYTEGLAFGIAIASLFTLDRAVVKSSTGAAFGAGLLAGLALLVRIHMLVIALGSAPPLLWTAWRRRTLRLAGAYAIGWIAAVTPWLVFRMLRPVRSEPIGRFVTWTESGSVAQYVADRLPGLFVAFDPSSNLSYFHSFGAIVAILPIAFAWFAWRAVRARGIGGWRDEWVLPVAAVAIALVNHAILLHFRADLFLPWLFGWRHGLPIVFALTVAIGYVLTRSPRIVRTGVLLLVVLTAASGALRIAESARTRLVPTAAENAFATWVDAQTPSPTMLTRRAQNLGMLTRGRYHWIVCEESPEQTRVMLERLPIDYVVVYDSDRRCGFLRGLGGWLAVEGAFGGAGEERIWLLRPADRDPRARSRPPRE